MLHVTRVSFPIPPSHEWNGYTGVIPRPDTTHVLYHQINEFTGGPIRGRFRVCKRTFNSTSVTTVSYPKGSRLFCMGEYTGSKFESYNILFKSDYPLYYSYLCHHWTYCMELHYKKSDIDAFLGARPLQLCSSFSNKRNTPSKGIIHIICRAVKGNISSPLLWQASYRFTHIKTGLKL